MINVSATYNTIIANGGHYEWQIVNGSLTVGGTMLSGSLKQTLYENASIGNVLSRQLDFEYFSDNITLDTTQPLQLQFRAVNDATSSAWYSKGQYWIDTIEQSPYTNNAIVTAFDDLLKANVTYLRTGTWTAKTDYAILTEVATDIGVTIESGTDTLFSANPILITEMPNIGESGTTDMQMLSYIAIMHGGNFIMNDDGELQFIALFAEQATGADAVDIGDAVSDFDASPSETITGVCLWVNGNYYHRYPQVTDEEWEALGGRKINATLPIGASGTLAQSLYTALGNKVYYPYTTAKAWVDPKWQLGDKITIKDVTSVICDQKITLNALAASELNAAAQEKINSSYPNLTPQERKLAQTEQSVASVEIQMDGIQSTVTELNGNITTMQTQVTQNASGLEVLTQEMEDQSNYIRWDGATGTVSIGGSGSSTEAQITPDGFAVVEHGEKILSAEGQKVVAKHLETETLSVGRYQWVDENYLGFSLIYTGA
jgi:uncharacterized coiled-coil protein SlyX